MWRGDGPKHRCVEKEETMMYIPLLETLECLLHNDTVLAEALLF